LVRCRDNVTYLDREALLLGLLGILGFSGTLPATRLAVRELDPWLVAVGRAVIAASLAGPCLWLRREPFPERRQLGSFACVALGTVLGFPLLSACALRSVPASEAAMVVAFVPPLTAMCAVVRNGERPGRLFWVCNLAGLSAVLAFLHTGPRHFQSGHARLGLASVLCALGYSEGARLARQRSGLWVVSWSLLLSLPILAPLLLYLLETLPHSAHASSWCGLAYVSLVSMFLAFVPWYGALARGGVALTSQLQLLQPLLSVCWAGWILSEHLAPSLWGTLAVVVSSIAIARRARKAPAST
jgi:drug/metabolite transporter (DMT)-like permease